MSSNYSMTFVAENTNIAAFYAIVLSSGQVTMTGGATVTLKGAAAGETISVSFADVQVSAPPCSFNVGFHVTPQNGVVAGEIEVYPAVSVPVTLTLLDPSDKPVGKPATVQAGQTQASFRWSV